MKESKKVICPWCHRPMALTVFGTIENHRNEGDKYECLGSETRPQEARSEEVQGR